MEDIMILALVEKKVVLLTTIANTSMLWWVSATVFCATLLGGIWRYKDQLETAPFKKWLAFLLYFFLGSVVLYGVLVTIIILLEFLDMRMLLTMLDAPPNLFDAEFFWLLLGLPVGTSSFVVFFLVWHQMWRSLNPPRAKERPARLTAEA